jgi:hypothetical protein
MKQTYSPLLIALACSAVSANAFADCGASATLDSTRAAYNKALQLEREGKLPGAFTAFIDAQETTCESNPIVADAARHAAALAATLGAAAEKNGDFEKAFRIYDAGGQYAPADRALMALVRARPDTPYVYETARRTLESRSLPSFQSNNKIRLSITGAYRADPENLVEVLAMPGNGAARAFQQDAAAFNEQYLREFVQLTQSTPDDPTDFEAMQAAMARHEAFARKWRNDPLKASRDSLNLAQSWASVAADKAVSDRIEAQRKAVLEQHVALLTKTYSGAPQLLEAALDFQLSINVDYAMNQQRASAIRSQAAQLGDDASAKHR